MNSLPSLAYYVSYFDLRSDQYNELHDIISDNRGFSEAVTISVDCWNQAILPRVADQHLRRFILRSHLVLRAVRCCEICGVSMVVGMALSRILADQTERIIRMEEQAEGESRE